VQYIEATPTYLHCPQCRLAVRSETADATRPDCPRCLERSGVSTQMYASPLDAAEMQLRLDKVRPFHGLRDASARLAHHVAPRVVAPGRRLSAPWRLTH
jgi:hypothetical protein